MGRRALPCPDDSRVTGAERSILSAWNPETFFFFLPQPTVSFRQRRRSCPDDSRLMSSVTEASRPRLALLLLAWQVYVAKWWPRVNGSIRNSLR